MTFFFKAKNRQSSFFLLQKNDWKIREMSSNTKIIFLKIRGTEHLQIKKDEGLK
jgi:hypothetical protein